jgi:hypothetical protein
VDGVVTTLLSAGQVVLIALIPLLALAAWLILVFGADRESRHRAPRVGSGKRSWPCWPAIRGG